MKLECAAKSYSIEIPLADFIRLEQYENPFKGFKEDALSTILDRIEGVDDTKYNGHFGPYIYLRIEIEHDTPRTHKAIIAAIQRRLNKCAATASAC
jgi:hypothetical protein